MSAQNSGQDPLNGSSSGQPTVRHIPIYVEGRDDPIINTSTDPASGNNNNNIHTKNGSHQVPQAPGQSEFLQNSASGNSIFNRVKSFPVRTGFDSDFFQGHSNHFGQRANSPGRQQVPVNVARRSASPAQVHRPHTPQTTQTTSAGGDAATTSTKNPIIGAQGHLQGHTLGGDPSIGKIQSIQRDVLALMDQVEKFDGTSKTDKKYLYLDEMLTQNLLKLDTIDTDGKENIKQARREAIKCINICIAALEKKAEAAAAAGRRGQ